MNTNKINLYGIMEAMNKAKTAQELKTLYRVAMKQLHPDNNNGESDIENIERIADAYTENMKRFHDVKADYAEHMERVRKATGTTARIRRNIATMDEFFSMDGSEQLGILTAYVIRVSTILKGLIPTPRHDRITDKTKADAYGNLDGVKAYAFAYYIFNRNGSVNVERVQECAHSAWIKACENYNDPDYHFLKPSTLLWISARQAVNNEWYKMQKHIKWIDQSTGKLDPEAYETKAPIEWTTEATAVHRVYIQEMDENQILALHEAGYNAREIADMIGTYQKKVDRFLKEAKARFDCEMLQEAGVNVDQTRRDESPISRRKRLIMQSIKVGMSYKRIAWHMGIAEVRNSKGEIVTVTDQIRALLTA